MVLIVVWMSRWHCVVRHTSTRCTTWAYGGRRSHAAASIAGTASGSSSSSIHSCSAPRGPMGWWRLAWAHPIRQVSNHAKQASSAWRRTCVRKELFKLFQQVFGMVKEHRYLRIHFVDRSLLLLVRLQDFQKLLVRIRIVAEPLLDLVDVANSMIELHRRP